MTFFKVATTLPEEVQGGSSDSHRDSDPGLVAREVLGNIHAGLAGCKVGIHLCHTNLEGGWRRAQGSSGYSSREFSI